MSNYISEESHVFHGEVGQLAEEQLSLELSFIMPPTERLVSFEANFELDDYSWCR